MVKNSQFDGTQGFFNVFTADGPRDERSTYCHTTACGSNVTYTATYSSVTQRVSSVQVPHVTSYVFRKWRNACYIYSSSHPSSLIIQIHRLQYNQDAPHSYQATHLASLRLLVPFYIQILSSHVLALMFETKVQTTPKPQKQITLLYTLIFTFPGSGWQYKIVGSICGKKFPILIPLMSS